MSKTIEFVEKEIKNIKELFELDDVLCLKTDEDYKFWYNRLQILEQIKCELEAWEVVKPSIKEIKEQQCIVIHNVFRDIYYKTIKKALEVEKNE